MILGPFDALMGIVGLCLILAQLLRQPQVQNWSPFPDKYARVHINPETFLRIYDSGVHTLVCGMTGSGKTTAAIYLIARTRQFQLRNGLPQDMIFIHEPGTKWEMLDLAKLMPINLFVPKGSLIKYEEDHSLGKILHRIHKIEFDPAKIESTLLNKASKRERINVIAFNAFYREPKIHGPWWADFTKKLLDWKLRGNCPHPITFYYDEINLLTPSKNYQMYPGQSANSAYIFANMSQYRSNGIKFLGTSFNIKMMYGGIVEHFTFIIFKQVNMKELLGTFEFLHPAIRALPKNVACILNEEREYDPAVDIPQVLDPRSHHFMYYLEDPTLLDSSDMWKRKLFEMMQKLTAPVPEGGYGLSKTQVGYIIGWTPQQMTNFVSQMSPRDAEDMRENIAKELQEVQASRDAKNEATGGEDEEDAA